MAYTWDIETQSYIAANGKPISARRVRGWIDAAVDGSKQKIRGLTQQLVDSKQTDADISAWRVEVGNELRNLHLATAQIASGGKELSNKQLGRIGNRLKHQYGYLDSFTLQIENKEIDVGGNVVARSGLYADAAVQSFEGMRRGNMVDAGFTKERNILGKADHCGECESETGRGWVGIGELIPVGNRTCLVNCRCRLDYR